MKRLIYISIFCSFISSCKIVNVLPIDYLQPAEVFFPSGVKNVAIVDNTLWQKEDNFKKNTEAKKEVFNEQEYGVFESNSKLVIEELAQSIADAEYFNQVIICDSALRKHDFVTRESKLSQQEVLELSQELDVDMLISLEDTKIYAKKNIFYVGDYPYPQMIIDAIITSQVRLYMPKRKEPMVTINSLDSIYWTIKQGISEKIINEASVFAASLPIKKLMPTWKTVDRYYYASGAVEMRDAAVNIKENTWDEAFNLWSRVYNKKSKKLKMRSAFNIALYYEMKDDLENAKIWAQKSQNLANKDSKEILNSKKELSEDLILSTYYLLDLDKRISEKQKLTLQMSRFYEENTDNQ